MRRLVASSAANWAVNMFEAFLLTARAIVQAADYLAGLERTAKEIKIKRRALAQRANALETILRSYCEAARHNAPMAAALGSFGDALQDALRLVRSCGPQNQSGVVGGLISFPYSSRRNLAMLAQAEETIDRRIKDLEVALKAPDRRPQTAVAPVSPVINYYYTIHNHGNMVLQQHQPRGGASNSAVPSSQSRPRPAVETGFALAIGAALHRQQLRARRAVDQPPPRR